METYLVQVSTVSFFFWSLAVLSLSCIAFIVLITFHTYCVYSFNTENELPCGGSDRKESACSAGDLGSTPGLGRSPGEGNGYSLQYPCLENSIVHV